MKVEILLNGVIKLVLIAENPIEQAALDQLGKSSELSTSMLTNTTAILNKTIEKGSLVLETKTTKA